MRALTKLHATSVLLILAAASITTMPSAGAGEAQCSGETATIVGTDGDDRLVGTSGDDVIAALDGDDYVLGRGGRDLLCGASAPTR